MPYLSYTVLGCPYNSLLACMRIAIVRYEKPDHCHALKDTIALTEHKISVPHSESQVNAFLFTTLLYESLKIQLNVDMGDYGNYSAHTCECKLGDLGFDTHVDGIRSDEKLTGEGVTFVDADFFNIIENKLPKAFGGKSTDYQLIEEEDVRGLTRLKLVISPNIGDIDEERVTKAFIDLLRQSENSPESWSQSGTYMWDQARTIRIKRDFPVPTRSGKILPFHISKSLKQ